MPVKRSGTAPREYLFFQGQCTYERSLKSNTQGMAYEKMYLKCHCQSKSSILRTTRFQFLSKRRLQKMFYTCTFMTVSSLLPFHLVSYDCLLCQFVLRTSCHLKMNSSLCSISSTMNKSREKETMGQFFQTKN